MTTGNIYLGLDPGWKGALAMYGIGTSCMPMLIDCPEDEIGMANELRNLLITYPKTSNNTRIWSYQAFVEKVWQRPGWGAKGVAAMMRNLHYWCAFFVWAGIPVELYAAATWQRIIKGERGINTKHKAWRYARRRFPNCAETLGPKPPRANSRESGRADALCILSYGLRNLNVNH